MALTTVFSVAKRANILLQVVDENVGTGNNSEKDFDLDKDNVITGTLTLSHSSSGDQNDFTELTETTHYTVDLPSGRIRLTSDGVSEVGTDTIYASYYYLAKLSEEQVSQFISVAEKRLEALTGMVWSSTTFIEYFDGVSRCYYPKTDRPFQWRRPEYDYVSLDHWPVRSVSEVWFVNRGQSSWGAVFSDDGGSFSDNTDEANTVSGSAFYVFSSSPAVNDAIYFGLDYRFLGLVTNLQTLGVDGGSLGVTWEYYDGSSWSALSNVTAGTTGADKFIASGGVSWDKPSGWEETSVNNSTNLYFVRARLSGGSYSTAPKLWEVYPDPDLVITRELSVRDIDVSRYGRLIFLNHSIVDGVRNIRVKYVAGVSSSDEVYELGVDLVNLLAALMCAVAITGGSFDDETSFTLGSWSSTVGEVYVNVREFVQELRGEIEALKSAIGGRASVV